MKSIVSFEIKKAMYCGIEFYSLYIDGSLYHNYTTLREAKRNLSAVIESATESTAYDELSERKRLYNNVHNTNY